MFKHRVSAPGCRATGKQYGCRSFSSCGGAARVSEPGCRSLAALGSSGMGPSDDMPSFLGRQDSMDTFSRQVSSSASWDFGSGSHDFVPPPVNTPTTEDALLYPPRWSSVHRPGIDLRKAGLQAVSHLRQVYVILFGVGQKDTEGIYSLRAFSPEGLPQETIVVFSTEEDAIRYAGLLEATMEHLPQVCSIPPRELLDFCVDAGYQCQLEQAGSLLIPPDFNVGITDWERSLRLREGQWSVLEVEPEVATTTTTTTTTTMQQTATSHTAPHWQPSEAVPTSASSSSYTLQHHDITHMPYSEEQLMDLRAKLEHLLPPAEPGNTTDDNNSSNSSSSQQ